jgi:hypothetical protein
MPIPHRSNRLDKVFYSFLQSYYTSSFLPFSDSFFQLVEMHRLIHAVGFGKVAKALCMNDGVHQASVAGVIIWFSVPACLALGSQIASEPFWWHEAVCQITLSFDAVVLY